MNEFIETPAWVEREVKRLIANGSAFAKRMPPVTRVRRRGFPRSVRRGDYIRRAAGTFCVVRRSQWHLWLEKVRDADGQPLVGATIRVRLPQRYLKETA